MLSKPSYAGVAAKKPEIENIKLQIAEIKAQISELSQSTKILSHHWQSASLMPTEGIDTDDMIQDWAEEVSFSLSIQAAQQ